MNNPNKISHISVYFSEFTGRFAVWAIISQLLMHVTSTRLTTDANGLYLVGATMSLLYLASVLGGAIKDFLLSEEQCIGLGMLFILVGNIILFQNNLMYLGIAILVLGGGLITPNTPLLIGKLTKNYNTNEKYFTHLYGCSNAGAISGPLIVGFLNTHYGWNAGLILTICLVVGWFFIVANCKGWNFCRRNIISYKLVMLLIIATFIATLYILSKRFSEAAAICLVIVYLCQLVVLLKRVSKPIRINIWVGMGLLLFAILFFSGEFQVASTATEYAKSFFNLNVINIHIPASSLMSFESVFVVIGALLMPKILQVLKVHNLQTRVIGGLILGSAAFGVLLFSSLLANTPGAELSIVWIIICFALLGIGEVTLMPPLIAFVDKIAPTEYKGRLMAGVYLSLSLAGILSGVISDGVSVFAKHSVNSISYFHKEFAVMMCVMFGAALLLLCIKILRGN